MANQEHLDLLKKSSEADDRMQEWNQWRTNNQEIQPNLSEANLNNATLRSADLNNAFLLGSIPLTLIWCELFHKLFIA